MKYVVLFLFLLLAQRPLFAQSCQPVQLATTAQQKEVLRKYLKESMRKHILSESKGVVEVIVFQDAQGLTSWYLNALLNDAYRSFPPATYAYFEDRVILVYQGDQHAMYLPIPWDKASREACMQDIVGSRVEKHTPKERFVDIRDFATGKAERVSVRETVYGDATNATVVRFNKDDTITEFTVR